jgi:hypothetical protein
VVGTAMEVVMAVPVAVAAAMAVAMAVAIIMTLKWPLRVQSVQRTPQALAKAKHSA